jgi:hypothetical protein
MSMKPETEQKPDKGKVDPKAAPPPDQDIDEEQDDERLNRIISRQVNGAMSQFKRVGMKEYILDAVKTSVAEALQGFKAPEVKETTTKQPDGDESPMVKQLRAETQALAAKLKAQEDAAREDKTKAQRAEERGSLAEALRSAGVPDNRLRGAVAELYLDQQRIKRDAEGRIVFTMQRDWGVEELPVEKGIAEWVKSDEGKIYMPPVSANGSGNQGGKPGKPAKPGDKVSRTQALMDIGNMMLGKVPGQ